MRVGRAAVKRKRSRKGENRLIRKILLTGVIVSLTGCIATVLLAELVVEPNLEDVSRIRAEVLVSRTINKALSEQFRQEQQDKELFSVKNAEDGTMKMVQADSVAINILMTELSMNIQEAFGAMKKQYLEVPAGALLGSKIFSQTGPDVKIAIVPLSVSSMDFKTEFESQGINQTKYKIYIVLECRVKVLAPFAEDTFKTSSTVLIAEAVILGEVPDSYVQVPQDDILDVTDN